MDKIHILIYYQHMLFFIQAMYAGTSISAGMKGASKAMAAMNKVR